MNVVKGKYGGYEGPMFRGSVPVRTAFASEPLHKLVGVTTSTEGGCYDSMNGYDRCVISVGAIQFCGAIGLIHPLLSQILSQVPDAAAKLRAWEGRYGQNVLELLGPKRPTAPVLASKLFGCDGREGSWEAGNWTQANALFAALQPLLIHPASQRIQLDHTASRILSFVMPASRFFFDKLYTEGWLGALQGAMVSFSANLPAVADKHFRAYVAFKGPPKNTPDYFFGALDAMTYNPKIAIYPHRRAAILKVLPSLYGIDLRGDDRTELRKEAPAISTQEMQQILIDLGYDLGPAGADGVVGKKTMLAIRTFQMRHKLAVDGLVGPKTLAKLKEEKVAKGLPWPPRRSL